MYHKDHLLMAEAYQQMQEGLYDRVRANASSIYNRVAQPIRNASTVVGSLVGGTGVDGLQLMSAKDAAKNAKIDSVLKSKTFQLQGIAMDIINDLNKLNLNPQDIGAGALANKLIEAIKSDLEGQRKTFTPSVPSKVSTPETIAPDKEKEEEDAPIFAPTNFEEPRQTPDGTQNSRRVDYTNPTPAPVGVRNTRKGVLSNIQSKFGSKKSPEEIETARQEERERAQKYINRNRL